MVVALLTMARAWFLDGRPSWPGRPLGSYETWSRIVGGILEYCGVKNFLTNLEELYDQTDDELNEWSAFLNAIFETFGANTAFSTKALVERISGESTPLYGSEEHNALRAALPESLGIPGEKGFPRRLGVALKKRKDQIYEAEESLIQLKAELPDRHRHKAQWKLIRIPSATIAPVRDGDTRNETRLSAHEGLGISFPGSTAEIGATVATGAKEGTFVFEDDPEERAAIQGEGE
jgi:hypothetical protein